MENWAKINGTDGTYSVSNEGRVRNNKTGRIMKPSRYKNGYLAVTIMISGKRRKFRIHRLVADYFIPNTRNAPQVNHKDENKTNNRADNLEWCTQLYNLNYGTRNARIARTLGTPVFQCDLHGRIIQEYPSVIEAARQVGCSESGIRRACNGTYSQYIGYKWRHAV